MTEAFLPWLDKLQKLYKSRGIYGRDDSYTDGKGDQEWIQKTKERIEQKKSYEKHNKEPGIHGPNSWSNRLVQAVLGSL